MNRNRSLQLSSEERSTLEHWINNAPQRGVLARRATRSAVLLALADGLDVHDISKRLHVQPSTIRKWRRRFVQERLQGLHDRARTGAPRRIAPERVHQALVLASEPTPDGARPWSTRLIAEVTGLSRSTVQRAISKARRIDSTSAAQSGSPPALRAPNDDADEPVNRP